MYTNIVFTEIYDGRNTTGVISLLVVVIKNKQIEYIEQNRTKSKDQVRLGSVIVLTEKFEFDFDRLPNIIEHN